MVTIGALMLGVLLIVGGVYVVIKVAQILLRLAILGGLAAAFYFFVYPHVAHLF